MTNAVPILRDTSVIEIVGSGDWRILLSFLKNGRILKEYNVVRLLVWRHHRAIFSGSETCSAIAVINERYWDMVRTFYWEQLEEWISKNYDSIKTGLHVGQPDLEFQLPWTFFLVGYLYQKSMQSSTENELQSFIGNCDQPDSAACMQP